MAGMATRLSRVEQVERNRELVLAAARRVFLARGYSGATLEGIAEEAGFSKGVMYSQFASKADLFLALLDRRITQRAAENAGIATRQAGAEGLRSLFRSAAQRSEANAEWARLLIEFRAHAARDPELNARYAAAHARTVDRFAEAIGQLYANAEREPPYPPRFLAHLALAIDHGTILERAADPDALPAELVEEFVVRAVVLPVPDSSPRR